MRLAGAGTSVQISTERALGYVLLPPQMPRGDMPWHRSHSQALAQAAVNKSPVGTDGPASLLSHPTPCTSPHSLHLYPIPPSFSYLTSSCWLTVGKLGKRLWD